MKLIEVVVGMFVLVTILLGGTRLLILSNERAGLFFHGLKNESEKISFYNYSQHLANNGTGYGYLSIGHTGFVNSQITGDYYYNCQLNTGNLIMINNYFSGVFCSIDYKGEMIYSYKLQ
ncbi:MAG: hypothetical protein V3575_02990 [Candidatus Absconditabacteria bacterium]